MTDFYIRFGCEEPILTMFNLTMCAKTNKVRKKNVINQKYFNVIQFTSALKPCAIQLR